MCLLPLFADNTRVTHQSKNRRGSRWGRFRITGFAPSTWFFFIFFAKFYTDWKRLVQLQSIISNMHVRRNMHIDTAPLLQLHMSNRHDTLSQN